MGCSPEVRPLTPAVRERVALLSLGGGVAMALLCLLLGELYPEQRWPSTYLPPELSPAPFLTWDVLDLVIWLAAFGALLGGRARIARGLSLAARAVTVGMAVVGRLLGLYVMPLHLAGFFAGLAVLAGLARVRLDRRGRLAFGLATGGFAVVLTLVAHSRVWPIGWGPRRAAFYRSYAFGVQVVSWRTGILLAAALLVGLVVSVRRPGWFTAVLMATLPWQYFWALFALGGNTVNGRFLALVLAAQAVLVGVAAVAHRAGRRGFVQSPPRT